MRKTGKGETEVKIQSKEVRQKEVEMCERGKATEREEEKDKEGEKELSVTSSVLHSQRLR